MEAVLKAFTGDPKVIGLAILVALDVLLGVGASLKTRTFAFGRLADFLRDDVLFKLLPFYALWAATYVGGDLVIPGIDVGALTAAGYATAVAAMAASIFGSLKDLGLGGGSEPPPPAEEPK